MTPFARDHIVKSLILISSFLHILTRRSLQLAMAMKHVVFYNPPRLTLFYTHRFPSFFPVFLSFFSLRWWHFRGLSLTRGINEFVDAHHDLHGAELKRQDWDAIATVSDWLLNFRSATSQMSMTSKEMLSSTHSIFCGLQRSLKDKLKQLPEDATPELMEGLTQAHRKLSDYYYKYDNSPFYIWAACMWCYILPHWFDFGTHLKCSSGTSFQLQKAEERLCQWSWSSCLPWGAEDALGVYFDEFYPEKLSGTTTAQAFTSTNRKLQQPGVIDFSAFDQGSDNKHEGTELAQYFDAPRTPSHTDPVQWWYAHWKIWVSLFVSNGAQFHGHSRYRFIILLVVINSYFHWCKVRLWLLSAFFQGGGIL